MPERHPTREVASSISNQELVPLVPFAWSSVTHCAISAGTTTLTETVSKCKPHCIGSHTGRVARDDDVCGWGCGATSDNRRTVSLKSRQVGLCGFDAAAARGYIVWYEWCRCDAHMRRSAERGPADYKEHFILTKR